MSTNLVVTFHVVSSRAWFRSTLRTIGRLHRFVSLDDVDALFQGSRSFNGACHITFDDGDQSFYDMAFPVLQEMGVPASLFVSPSVVADGAPYWFQEVEDLVAHHGEPRVRAVAARALGDSADLGGFSLYMVFKCLPRREMTRVIEAVRAELGRVTRPHNLSVAQLRAVASSGLVAVGAHTLDHPILANEDHAESDRQIRASVEGLGDLIGRPVWSFAYPNGIPGLDFGEREKASLRASGVRLAFSTALHHFGRKSDPLAIPRTGFSGTPRERPPWVAAKLLLTPVYEATKELLKRHTEAKDRAVIRARLGGDRGHRQDSRNET